VLGTVLCAEAVSEPALLRAEYLPDPVGGTVRGGASVMNLRSFWAIRGRIDAHSHAARSSTASDFPA
jgi:hypothetical protein